MCQQFQHLVQPNHSPATLLEARHDQSSYPDMLTYLLNQIVIPLKQAYLSKISLILPHLQL